MEINQEAEKILKKFSDLLEQIPDLEETQYMVDNLNRTREDVNKNSDYEKILRNAYVDKNGSVVSEKGKWTK